MSLVANKAVEEVYPNYRQYIVSRSGFAGIQRYAQTWAGDNSTSWKSLKFNIPVILGLGLSGVANQGFDIGGFYGEVPEPELFVRWVQNGIFQPRFSIHSCNNDNTVTEPWMYPSYTKYIREAIKLRYKLVPYMYSLV
ncbi:Oligosaccharide 4-alpha-D-glucosyltransferase [Clostridium felsineum]|nr:Oligosaccharide 4-alpha-D-glucosyltransferase [Clostridium felsineum]